MPTDRMILAYFSQVLGRKRGEPSGSHALLPPHVDSDMEDDMLSLCERDWSHGTGSDEKSHHRVKKSSIDGQLSFGQRLVAPQGGLVLAQKHRGTRMGQRDASFV